MTINLTIVPATVYFGTSGEDNLTGSTGNDVFNMTANDWVTDTINGGAGIDTVNYSASSVAVKITLTDAPLKGGLPTGGMVEADFAKILYNYTTHTYTYSNHHQVVADLTSIENATGSNFNDVLKGNSADNVLKGGAGDDVIDGGDGNDTIYSGLGADTLTGGQGFDTFVYTDYRDSGYTHVPLSGGGYNLINHGVDVIQDFVTGEDKIDLSRIDADSVHSGDQAFHIVDQFTGHAGELRVFLGTSIGTNDAFERGWFSLSGDIDGDGSEDFHLAAYVNSVAYPMVDPATDFLL